MPNAREEDTTERVPSRNECFQVFLLYERTSLVIYFASSECHMHQYKLLLGKLVMHITEPWFLSWIGPAAIWRVASLKQHKLELLTRCALFRNQTRVNWGRSPSLALAHGLRDSVPRLGVAKPRFPLNIKRTQHWTLPHARGIGRSPVHARPRE